MINVSDRLFRDSVISASILAMLRNDFLPLYKMTTCYGTKWSWHPGIDLHYTTTEVYADGSQKRYSFHEQRTGK